MTRYIPIILLIALCGCKPITLTTDLNDRDTYRLFRQSKENNTVYNIRYNSDSTFALCILNDQSELVSEPVSFFIIDLSSRKKVLVSLNEYHKAEWIDSRNVRMVFYSGITNFSRDINKKPGSNSKEFIFNVISKQVQLSELENINPLP